MGLIECPQCSGRGFVGLWKFPKSITINCDMCDGKSEIPEYQLKWIKKGKLLSSYRKKLKITLAQASKLTKIDVITLSKIERGIIEPKTNYFN